MSIKKLKSCPFCNGKAIYEWINAKTHRVSCENCYVFMERVDIESVFKSWNRRTYKEKTNDK